MKNRQKTNTPLRRVKGLKKLLSDALKMGFSVSLIGDYERQLKQAQTDRQTEKKGFIIAR